MKRPMTRQELISWNVANRKGVLSEASARELAEKQTDEWLLCGYQHNAGIGISRRPGSDDCVPSSSARCVTQGIYRGASQDLQARGIRH